MLHVVSSVVIVILGAGLWARTSHPSWHRPFMTAAFLLDLALVIYIEATRHAVETAVGRGTWWIWFHAAVSTLVLAAYVLQFALGSRLRSGAVTPRSAHIAVGTALVALRLTNYVTSFLV